MKECERPRLCLWGFMGTGKTTVGALLADRIGAKLIDLDARIEAEAKMTISDIFEQFGEAEFREREHDALCDALRMDATTPVIIALGGGALVNEDARALAKRTSFVVTLAATAAEIARRIADDASRPLLASDTQRTERMETIAALLARRQPAYDDVHAVVTTSGRTPYEVTEDLAKRWTPFDHR